MLKNRNYLTEKYQLLVIALFLVLVLIIEYQWWSRTFPDSIRMSEQAVSSIQNNGVDEALLPMGKVVEVPFVEMIDHRGNDVFIADLMDQNQPVVLQFIFTSCKAVCPVMATTFSKAQEFLQSKDASLISISIDPMYDTPGRLSDYAKRFQAGEDWHFLTGQLDDVKRVSTAFEAMFAGSNKMAHKPLLYIRPEGQTLWFAVDALTGVDRFKEQFIALSEIHP